MREKPIIIAPTSAHFKWRAALCLWLMAGVLAHAASDSLPPTSDRVLRVPGAVDLRDSLVSGSPARVLRLTRANTVLDSLRIDAPSTPSCGDTSVQMEFLSFDPTWYYLRAHGGCPDWVLLRVERRRLIPDAAWVLPRSQLEPWIQATAGADSALASQLLWYSAPSADEALLVQSTAGSLRFVRASPSGVHGGEIWSDTLGIAPRWITASGSDTVLFVQGHRVAMLAVAGDFLGRWEAQPLLGTPPSGYPAGPTLLLSHDEGSQWTLWQLPPTPQP